ncbi:D-alanyl-D-alanine carboxypeptidase [Lachnospiraceae bacterium ZAX-1]
MHYLLPILLSVNILFSSFSPIPYDKETIVPIQYEKQANIPNQYKVQANIPSQYKVQAALPIQYKVQAALPIQYKVQANIPSQYKVQAALPIQYKVQANIPSQYEVQAALSSPYEEQANLPIQYEDDTNLPATQAISVSAPSALLMEASTGSIIYEKDAKTKLRPASITKIMTLILIFDALEKNVISLSDTVTVSEYAASMGGSQVFLESGETQTVDTMIKCISVASANDACVAMAEFICGSEPEFVNQMNIRAKGLKMDDTTFVNSCGLDVDGHTTTAFDVALMSRELITKYPQIHHYSTIWMENITHVTAKGASEFGLTNTNKLIRQYEYATGLKTGSTSLAKYCVSATAEKDGLKLIAVIMAAPDYKIRFLDATALLSYGFAKCNVYTDENKDRLPELSVTRGVQEQVPLKYENLFRYLDTAGSDFSNITKEIQIPETAPAPIHENAVAGKAIYKLNGQEIGFINLLYATSIKEAYFKDYFMKVLKSLFV